MRELLRSVVLVALLSLGSLSVDAGDYLLDSGDRLRIHVQDWPQVNGEAVVAPDGTIAVAGVGHVQARGLSSRQLATAISEQLRTSSGGTAPVAVIEVVGARPVFVLGDVAKPAAYEFQPGLTVMKAIALAGGFYRPPVTGAQRFEREIITARGELLIAEEKAMRLRLRQAVLEAELRGSEKLELPSMPPDKRSDPDFAAALADARATLAAGRQALQERIEGARSLQKLLESEIQSTEQQMAAETSQLQYVKREIDKMQDLAKRGLASSPRMLDLERNAAQITGTRQSLQTNIIRARQEIQKLEQRISDFREERAEKVRTELLKLRVDLSEAEQKQATSRRLVEDARSLISAEPIDKEGGARSIRHFVIMRGRPDEQQAIPATLGSPLEPGDVLDVQRSIGDGRKEAQSSAAVR